MKYLCSICGYEHEGSAPPDYCPICKAPKNNFMLTEKDPPHEKVSGRFEVISRQKIGPEGYANEIEILRDTVTGVHYVWRYNHLGGGLTVLVDSEGKPISTNYSVEI